MKEGDSMTQHVNSFDTKLRRLIDGLKETDSTSPYWNLAIYLENHNIKAHYLLMTLLNSYNNIVDNLQSKTGLTYLDVRNRLLKLVSTTYEAALKNKALLTNNNNNNKVNKKPNPPHPRKLAPITGNNRSWCHSKGKPHQGHIFKTCQALKEHNASKLGAQNSPPSSKEIIPYQAATAQELFIDNGVAIIVSSFSSTHLVPLSNFTSTSANYTIYEASWLIVEG
ncbi:hypothetical protein EV426DRAFT_706991 [Tirmania nivea]|nr:hypothetical protein EV426DRAFT_706991 [Tirmania nivea]